MKNSTKSKICAFSASIFLVAGCSDATVASHNLSRSADMFGIDRRVVFYDTLQGLYLLSIEGRCSIKKDKVDNQLEVTCKTGPGVFKKHFLVISDNVTYFADQLEPAGVDVYRYRVIFKPEVIVPDVDLQTSIGAKP